jgi:hypothetical protein
VRSLCQFAIVFASAACASAQTRLYRIAADGVQLFAERPPVIATGSTASFSNGDGIALPQVSDDGQTVAYTVRGGGGSVAEIRGATTLHLGPGSVQISRNGKWAVLSCV